MLNMEKKVVIVKKLSYGTVMDFMIFSNSNAVFKPKRSSKKREIQTLCILGLLGLAMLSLSGCEITQSSQPSMTLKEKGGDRGGSGSY